ncbi:MAG: exodeoxyribonuclease III [Proteobacteria bacterium]|nr:exodeoxyribonuclease III [Pseudomonadota bacterium]
MRIATWNINGMKARFSYLARWLADVQPDVVGLQELKMTDDQFPRELFKDAGYHAATHGQKGWNGVAILTREPAEVTQVGLPGQEEMGARLLTVDVADLSFSTVYCPNGKSVEHEDFQRKLSWFDALGAHIAERHHADQPVVLCGDFNIVPAAIDSWNEDRLGGFIFHTEAERSRLKRLLNWGLFDIFRSKHPDQPGFTWWDYRGGAFHKQQGLRIDLVLATANVAERVTAVHLERRWRKKLEGMIPSDHAPMWVDLD